MGKKESFLVKEEGFRRGRGKVLPFTNYKMYKMLYTKCRIQNVSVKEEGMKAHPTIYDDGSVVALPMSVYMYYINCLAHVCMYVLYQSPCLCLYACSVSIALPLSVCMFCINYLAHVYMHVLNH